MAVLKEFAQPLNTIFSPPLYNETINLKLFPPKVFSRAVTVDVRKDFKYMWYSNDQLQIVPKLRGRWACEGQNNVARVNNYTLRARDGAQRAEMSKTKTDRTQWNIHPSSISTSCAQGHRVMECTRSVFTLDDAPFYHPGHKRHAGTYELSISLTCMSLESGRKPEHLERSHVDRA